MIPAYYYQTNSCLQFRISRTQLSEHPLELLSRSLGALLHHKVKGYLQIRMQILFDNLPLITQSTMLQSQIN